MISVKREFYPTGDTSEPIEPLCREAETGKRLEAPKKNPVISRLTLDRPGDYLGHSLFYYTETLYLTGLVELEGLFTTP